MAFKIPILEELAKKRDAGQALRAREEEVASESRAEPVKAAPVAPLP